MWWERMDSNHRSRRQQIYSLPPLAARELSHVLGINKSLSLFVELVMGLEPATCWLQISCSTNWATPASYLRTLFKKWWELQGSNLWHPACKADALPAELNSHLRWPVVSANNIDYYSRPFLLCQHFFKKNFYFFKKDFFWLFLTDIYIYFYVFMVYNITNIKCIT